jgi:pimeloyl-ACP methyl ester carboxylesterase
MLIPPIGLDSGFWSIVEPQQRDAVTPEYPGCVTAGPAMTGSSVAALADSAAELLSRYDEPVDLVGVSMGGMVATSIAVQHPGRVRSLLVACCGPAAPPQMMHERALRFRTEPYPDLVEETLGRWFSAEALSDPQHVGVGYARAALMAREPGVVADGWDAIADYDVRDALGDIGIPVTVVGGRDDMSTPVAAVEALSEGIPGSKFVVLAGRHLLMLEDPDAFNRVLNEHLEGVEARQS